MNIKIRKSLNQLTVATIKSYMNKNIFECQRKQKLMFNVQSHRSCGKIKAFPA